MSVHDAFVILEVLCGVLLHGAVVVSILLTQRRQPTATLAWILTVTLVPFLGLVLYLIIGRTRTLRLVRRSRAVAKRLEEVFHRCGARTWGPLDGAEQEEPRTL